jgi:uncharacterized protein YjbI with pentapeptide repeats
LEFSLISSAGLSRQPPRIHFCANLTRADITRAKLGKANLTETSLLETSSLIGVNLTGFTDNYPTPAF